MKFNNSLTLRISALFIVALAAPNVLADQVKANGQSCCEAPPTATAKGTAGTGTIGKSVASVTVGERAYRISAIGSVSAQSNGQNVTLRIGTDEFLAQPTALRFNNAEILKWEPSAKRIELELNQNILTVNVDEQLKYRKALDDLKTENKPSSPAK